MGILQKLESRWGVKGWVQILIILVVFAVTGSSSVYVGRWVMSVLGMTSDMTWYIWYPVRILVVFFAYQLLLLMYAFLFGQFKFFWNFEKKMLSRFGIKIKDNDV